MADFLTAAALVVLATVAAGLLRLRRGPGAAERMLAVQLLGTGSIAVVLLLEAASGPDIALTLAVLAALAPAAFAQGGDGGTPRR
ncbi:Sodium:proton antiporter [Rhodovastum atsumiense]|uniref:Sodium:proton antiporter n=1 Tax=Rhodovastum atsumiense TaxID=504468 RepID=A0A5M6IJB6_9PROT|nr:sodium:proton antiporter [Rhodovastum atsumiense]KAA5608340.1 sodium:proton antiporter [Rhodovastum atsumiense]CAH2602346.1 Sodium:proton antiporter [Rhodovastum atsumiense]